MKTEILGVPVDTCTFDEALMTLLFFLDGDKTRMCVTPNPEMIMAAGEDAGLMAALRQADLVVPDGVGVVVASRFGKRRIPERVAGCDLVHALFAAAAKRPFSVYLLGGKPGVAEAARKNIQESFAGVTVAGARHGYFDEEQETLILGEIGRLAPDVLLVGLGTPRQEKWMNAHKPALPVKLMIGVGGTLDVLAGVVQRAPAGFQRLGLEWLYRLARQPSRFGRMLRLPAFLLRAVADGVKKRDR